MHRWGIEPRSARYSPPSLFKRMATCPGHHRCACLIQVCISFTCIFILARPGFYFLLRHCTPRCWCFIRPPSDLTALAETQVPVWQNLTCLTSSSQPYKKKIRRIHSMSQWGIEPRLRPIFAIFAGHRMAACPGHHQCFLSLRCISFTYLVSGLGLISHCESSQWYIPVHFNDLACTS